MEVVKRLPNNQVVLQSTENDQLHLYERRDHHPGAVVVMFRRAYGFVRYLEPHEVPNV